MATASPIDVIQTCTALLGAWLTARAWRELHLQVQWLEAHELNGQRLYWSRARRTEKAILLIAQTVLLVSGVADLVMTPPTLAGPSLELRAWSETIVSIVLLAKTLQERIARGKNESFQWDGVERRRATHPRRQKGSPV